MAFPGLPLLMKKSIFMYVFKFKKGGAITLILSVALALSLDARSESFEWLAFSPYQTSFRYKKDLVEAHDFLPILGGLSGYKYERKILLFATCEGQSMGLRYPFNGKEYGESVIDGSGWVGVGYSLFGNKVFVPYGGVGFGTNDELDSINSDGSLEFRPLHFNFSFVCGVKSEFGDRFKCDYSFSNTRTLRHRMRADFRILHMDFKRTSPSELSIILGGSLDERRAKNIFVGLGLQFRWENN